MSRSHTATPRIRMSNDDVSLKVRDIPLKILTADPNQPRQFFSPEGLKELADSVERYGLLQPITVKQKRGEGGAFIVVAGERRFRAFQMLDKETIPAVVTTGDADEIALIENLQREDLSPVEEAKALANLKKKHGYTLDELGASIGKAKNSVSGMLRINDLPLKIKKEVLTSEHVGRSFLIELARLDDKKQQLKLWKDAKRGNLTIRDLRRKKRAPDAQPEKRDSKRTLTLGKRFATELNKLADRGDSLNDDDYDTLLEIYQEFLKFFEENTRT